MGKNCVDREEKKGWGKGICDANPGTKHSNAGGSKG